MTRRIAFTILSFVLAVSSIMGQVRIGRSARETSKSHNCHMFRVGMQKLQLVLEIRYGFCAVSLVEKGAGRKAGGKSKILGFFIIFLDREQVNPADFPEETV